MGAVHMTNRIKDFTIAGPALARGNRVIESIHALYFLPENYKLVFTGSEPVDQTFYNEVVSLVERNALGSRVHFAATLSNTDATIADPQAQNGVDGDSPEALASAILNVARARA